jgi:cytochrome bd-type quinol oxidase subunit 2
MMPFALGIVSGKLFDGGYFHAVEIAGGALFSFSQVFRKLSAVCLQLIAVPKARIGNLLFWDVFKEFLVSQ